MKSSKTITAKSGRELADVLGLSPVDAVEWGIRAVLNDKIIELVEKSGVTHSSLSKRASTSRPRITALLNRRRDDISTDLMFRVLVALGYVPRLSFKKLAV